LVVATTNQGKYAAIHNTKVRPGETLSTALIRSKTGFLLNMAPVRAKVDEEKVKKEMVQLEKVVVIAYFVGRQQSVKTLLEWLGDLSKETHEELVLGNNLGQGFFQITCKGEAAAQKVLMRTPHHSRWGTSIL
jgi:cell division inhibitor SulA